MFDQGDLSSALNGEVVPSLAGQTTLLQRAETKMPQDSNSEEDRRDSVDDDEQEEEVRTSAHLEPSTLPWPGDRNISDEDDNASGSEERDTGISRGSQDLSEEQSQVEGDVKSKWRESMPEGERWRDDDIQVERKDEGLLADDEEEEEKEDWPSEKHSLGFTPHVEVLCPSSKDSPEEDQYFREEALREEQREAQRELLMEHNLAAQFYSEWEEQDKYCEFGSIFGLSIFMYILKI